MYINILLPFKDKFDLYKSSSVSNTVKNNLFKSRYKDSIRVFGQDVTNPISKKHFFGIKKPLNFLKSKNKYLADQMCKFILLETGHKQIIEIHNRPYLLKLVNKKLKNYPITLFFHNNPQQMKGSITVKDREFLIKNSSGIFCVSNFIRNKFLEGISIKVNNVFTIYNGVERMVENIPLKKKEIIFVGRLVPEKGLHLYVDSINQIASKYKEWKFYLIGSKNLSDLKLTSKYAYDYSKKFNDIGPNTYNTGYLSYNEVQKKIQSASIIVIPSIWDEPFGLVVAEAMSNGTAVITSKVGGIPEIISNNGILLKDINTNKITKSLENLIRNPIVLKKYQKLSWDNFKFSSKTSSEILDNYREDFLSDNSNSFYL